MSSKRLETVKLTARFKLNGKVDESLFETYKAIVNELLDYAHSKGITSFKRLKAEKYHELRQRYPLPSHYIYTACQMACSIYKSFRKLKREGKAKSDKPKFKRDVIMLDDHLFKLDLESWTVNIATPNGRIKLKLLHGEYHEKFKNWKVGQAWLVKRVDGIYLNVVFSRNVEVRNCGDVIGVDINENNVTVATPTDFVRFETREREIRTAYFVKRRKIQKKIKCTRVKSKILAKYRNREKNRVLDVYHKVANEIVKIALKMNSAIALENLKNIRSRINYSRELNGRLHRWSFRKFQQILEYKAKLNGIEVIYVNPHKTSSLCPICGSKLSPNGQRLLKCMCGLEADRDVIGSWNIRLKALKMWGVSVPPESPSMNPETGRLSATNASKVINVAESQNGYSHRFVKNTFRVLKSARMVEVVEGIDDICKACPYCIDKKCGNPRTSDERIRELDELTLSLLSIKIGSRIRLDEVRRKIPKILPVWIKKACKSCNWWKICKNILVKTSLPNQMANIR